MARRPVGRNRTLPLQTGGDSANRTDRYPNPVAKADKDGGAVGQGGAIGGHKDLNTTAAAAGNVAAEGTAGGNSAQMPSRIPIGNAPNTMTGQGPGIRNTASHGPVGVGSSHPAITVRNAARVNNPSTRPKRPAQVLGGAFRRVK